MLSSLIINRVQTKFNSLKILLNGPVLRKASVILQKKMFLLRVYRFQVVKEKFVVKGTATGTLPIESKRICSALTIKRSFRFLYSTFIATIFSHTLITRRLSSSVHFISSRFNCSLDSTVLVPQDETRLD